MRRDDFRVLAGDDLPRLGLENQFLALEAQTLRAKVGRVDSMIAEKQAIIDEKDVLIARLRSDIETLTARPAVPEGSVIVDATELESLRQARRDLQWMLRRIESTILGPLLKRRSGFGRLVRTYLND